MYTGLGGMTCGGMGNKLDVVRWGKTCGMEWDMTVYWIHGVCCGMLWLGNEMGRNGVVPDRMMLERKGQYGINHPAACVWNVNLGILYIRRKIPFEFIVSLNLISPVPLAPLPFFH